MTDAFLLEPVGQRLMVIGRKAIRHQRAAELPTQDLDYHVVPAAGLDGVGGQVAVGEGPQPGGQRANAPAGFARVHHRTLLDQVYQRGIHWAHPVERQPGIRLTQATPGERQGEGHPQHLGHFSVGDP